MPPIQWCSKKIEGESFSWKMLMEDEMSISIRSPNCNKINVVQMNYAYNRSNVFFVIYSKNYVIITSETFKHKNFFLFCLRYFLIQRSRLVDIKTKCVFFKNNVHFSLIIITQSILTWYTTYLLPLLANQFLYFNKEVHEIPG